ncbi:MAG: tetratricopeptide repeat protein [Candidatus Omnitrophota bacterium]
MFKKYARILVAAGLILAATRSIGFASDKLNAPSLSHFIMGVFYDDLGDVDRAIGEYKKALSADDEITAIRLSLAAGFIRKKDLTKAAQELKRVISLDPEAVEPHAILAALYSIQDKKEQAQNEYESALKNASKLNPNDVGLYQALGALYLKQNKLKEALGVYRIISVLSPDDPKAHFYLGTVYAELKDYWLCEAELKQALELNPDYSEALNYLGYEYVEWGKDLNKAEKLIRKAVKLEPGNGAYIDSLGWVYYKKGKFRKAAELLEKAASLMEDPAIYGHLGDTYFKLNEAGKAKLNWKKSLELDSKQEKIRKKIEALDKNAGNAKPN